MSRSGAVQTHRVDPSVGRPTVLSSGRTSYQQDQLQQRETASAVSSFRSWCTSHFAGVYVATESSSPSLRQVACSTVRSWLIAIICVWPEKWRQQEQIPMTKNSWRSVFTRYIYIYCYELCSGNYGYSNEKPICKYKSIITSKYTVQQYFSTSARYTNR